MTRTGRPEMSVEQKRTGMEIMECREIIQGNRKKSQPHTSCKKDEGHGTSV